MEKGSNMVVFNLLFLQKLYIINTCIVLANLLSGFAFLRVPNT